MNDPNRSPIVLPLSILRSPLLQIFRRAFPQLLNLESWLFLVSLPSVSNVVMFLDNDGSLISPGREALQ